LAELHATGKEWVRFSRLCQNRDWYKKFSAGRISRTRQALAKEGVLIEEQDEMQGQTDGNGQPVYRKTGRVQLAKQENI
jgi:hypothetical protein